MKTRHLIGWLLLVSIALGATGCTRAYQFLSTRPLADGVRGKDWVASTYLETEVVNSNLLAAGTAVAMCGRLTIGWNITRAVAMARPARAK